MVKLQQKKKKNRMFVSFINLSFIIQYILFVKLLNLKANLCSFCIFSW